MISVLPSLPPGQTNELHTDEDFIVETLREARSGSPDMEAEGASSSSSELSASERAQRRVEAYHRLAILAERGGPSSCCRPAAPCLVFITPAPPVRSSRLRCPGLLIHRLILLTVFRLVCTPAVNPRSIMLSKHATDVLLNGAFFLGRPDSASPAVLSLNEADMMRGPSSRWEGSCPLVLLVGRERRPPGLANCGRGAPSSAPHGPPESNLTTLPKTGHPEARPRRQSNSKE